MLLVELTGTPLNNALIALPSAASLKHRGCSMRVDVIDVGRGDVRALKSPLHCLSRSDAGWLRLCDVKVVGGNTVADDFRENRRTALASEVEIFQGQNRSTFTEHHARPMPIKRAAFLRR